MAIRKVSVKLGPIPVDAGILGALDDEGAGLRSVCTHGTDDKRAPALIKRRDYCPTCDNDVKDTFRKGRVEGNTVVILDTDVVASLAVDETLKRSIELTVHPAATMAAAFPTGKCYYLEARPGAGNTYVLLATLLAKRQDLAFVGEFSFGGPSSHYLFQVDDGVITMRQLAHPEAVRQRPQIDGIANLAYLELAEQFADAISRPYDPAAYADKRKQALAEAIATAMPVALADSGTPAAPAAETFTDMGAALTAALAALSPAPAAPPAPRRARKAAAAVPAEPEKAPARRAPRRKSA